MPTRSPILLVHGFTDSARTWAPLTPLLEPHHDVLAPTLLGHHGGAPVPNPTADPGVAMVDALERTLDERGIDQAHIVGNSLGGWLALELAARGRARSVVALSPANGWEAEGGPEEQRVLQIFARTRRVSPVGAKAARHIASRPRLRALALRDVVAHGERISPPVAQSLIEGPAACTMYPHLVAMVKAGGYRKELAAIDVPVRIAWGDRDRTLPKARYSSYFQTILPAAEWIDLHDSGHLPHHDDPHLVAHTVLEVTRRVDAAG